MNEMVDPVERVAKAIFNQMFAEHERGKWDTDDWLRNRYLDCANAAIAAMPEPWQPIETVPAPRDGTWVMICRAEDGFDSYEVGHYDPYLGHWCGFNNMRRATHWMLLEEPPELE